MRNETWLLLLVHAFASVFMAGLIWVIQLVHYPLMARVGVEQFHAYEIEHMRRITLIVGPMMLLEAAAAIVLAYLAWNVLPRWMIIAGLALLLTNWISTATLQGPMHASLARRYSLDTIGLLVSTNWIRTAAWTARGVLSLAMIWSTVRR